MNNIPKKFVSLHGHSNASIFDAIGNPLDIFNSILNNGMDSSVISDHGNMNNFVSAWLAQKELNKKGKIFKFLPAIEFYFHPSLKQWKEDYFKSKEDKEKQKKADQEKTAIVEDESETKSNKYRDPARRRHHLVAIAKTSKGLQNLFSLVSRSYKDGFYYFPRIDFEMLKEFGEDIILSTACIGSLPAFLTFQNFPNKNVDELVPELLDDDINIKNKIISDIENMSD